MKKIIAIVLVCLMVLPFMVACTKKTAEAPKATEAPAATEAPKADEPAKEIKIWVADAIVDFTKEQAAAWQAANPQYAGYAIKVEAVGEGDAASNVLTDVEAAADLYGFPTDQLARLVSAGAILELSEENAAVVKEENDVGSVGAATLGGTVYAYPLTSDNGYFLYYDKSVIADPSTLEGIEEACKAAGKNFYMDIRSGWYDVAFFFGAGCMLTYDTDDAGKYTACNIDYASDKGVAALKAMINLKKSGVFVNGSSVDNATNAAAIVDGTWDSSAAKALFGDNYACAKLPTFTENGQTYQMGGFGGFKLLGVKPQTDEAKLEACDSLALYLSSEAVQLARYDLTGWGPSNLKAKASEKVQADAALTALGEQLAFCVVQGQYPGDYWSRAEALGDSIIAGEYDAADDAALLAVLQQFQDDCVSYAK